MSRLGMHRHFMISFSLAVLLIIPRESYSEARDAPYETLRGEVARMACQIPPEDRYGLAVLAPVADWEELQDCIGRPLTEAVIQVLLEFQFTLIERGLFSGEGISRVPRMTPCEVSKNAERIGARSILTGSVNIDHENIHLTYRMTRIETMEIMGALSCSLSKKEFTDCFLKYDLSPPRLGIYSLLPEPRRIP